MPKAVIVNYRECTGCRICELACSIRNEGVASARLSRIRVYPFPPGLDVPVICVQCDKAPCIEACPLGLLSRDSKSGAVVIQEELCNGCGLCMNACPAQAIFMHPTRHVAIKCHLCQGEPECVKLCPTEALSHYELPFDTRIFAKKPEKIAEELRKHVLMLPEER
ncbi:MAG: 4Fe-4S dicluster domain-containing protein [Candidatus Bathyarchaeia archaeon]